MAYTTIDNPVEYFNTKLYTGTGSSNSLTGVGFKPDWVWIKKRNGAVGHRLYDAVRGVQNTLFSNDTAVEATGQSTTLTAFNSDGFTVISESGVNASSDTYVAWNWLGANTTVSNTSGSITSTVSANTTSGFSIVSYTGTGANASIGHGLGKTPAMIICKSRSDAEEWATYHQSLGTTKYIVLNSVAAANSTARFYQAPTSSLFYVDNGYGVNKSSATYIAYCFAEVKGYSKIDSFVGNGSTDGTFVYTGFKPAYIIQKKSTTGSANAHWRLIDSTRSPYNVSQDVLFPALSNTEASGETDLDILSNGFKIREGGIYLNESGITYIYMAFASNPFVSSKGIPTTAR